MNDEESIITFLHTLGYVENGEWCALCLEMDLVGIGDTFDEAFEDLQQLIKNQFALAKEKNDPGLVLFPADPKYFRMFAEAMSKDIIGRPPKTTDQQVRSVRMPIIAA